MCAMYSNACVHPEIFTNDFYNLAYTQMYIHV